jgi:tagatose 6-phosphate kinase
MIVIPSLATSRDVIVEATAWAPGAVLRASRGVATPGGKPLNIARDCARMGIPVRLVVLADRLLSEEVEQERSTAVDLSLIVSTIPSRTDICLTNGEGTSTVVNGAVQALAAGELAAAMELLESVISPGDVLVLAGRQPPGATSSIVSLARRKGARLVVDTSGSDLNASLAEAPEIVKVTADELAEMEVGQHSQNIWRNGRVLIPQPVELAVSDGANGVRGWLSDGQIVEVRPPTVEIVNPFGAGDALTAGIASAAAEDRSLLDGLVRGTAWAAACVERLGVDFDADRAGSLVPQVSVKFASATPNPDRMSASGVH